MKSNYFRLKYKRKIQFRPKIHFGAKKNLRRFHRINEVMMIWLVS